jgi:hypothetical protein
MATGAVFGALSSICFFMSMRAYFEMGSWPRLAAGQRNPFTNAELIYKTEIVAIHDYWWAGNVIPHAIAQFFFTVADLLILQRVVSNVTEAQPVAVKIRIKRLSYCVALLLSLLNAANIASMLACGAFNIEAGHEFLRASAAFRGGNHDTGAAILHDANVFNDQSNQIQGARFFSATFLILTLC